MLCSIHKGFCFRQGVSSPISDLTERLLLEERDPPAMPQESLYEAPPFDEVRNVIGIIILCHSFLESSRHDDSAIYANFPFKTLVLYLPN